MKNMIKKAAALCLSAVLALPLPAFAVSGGSLANASFEQGLTDWILDGSSTPGASYLTTESYAGKQAFTCWSGQPYTSHIYQTIEDIAPGYYTLTARTQSSGYQDCAYLYANGARQGKCMTSIPATNDQNRDAKGWNTVTVRGIHVGDDRKLTVGFYTEADGRQFVNLDDLQLKKEKTEPRPFLLGGDISQLNYVEDCGGKFYDAGGKETDAIQALAENGWNYARVRLYNDPGKGHGDGWNYCLADYSNEEDVLDLSRRAREKGMTIELSFHYSDYWTNGVNQIIPAGWQKEIEGLDQRKAVSRLEELVYTYTKDFMQRMADQGTVPEYVSLGNEIQGGMLYPYGKAGSETWPNLARFFNAGAKAVKEVSPDTQIIIHLDGCGDSSKYTVFFDAMKKHRVQYDIIGASYYPFFANCSVNQVTDFCDELIDRYDKDIVLMETGYNWNPTRPDGWTGQLVNNGNYTGVYNSTPEGQKAFLIDLFHALRNVKDGRCIGDLYWDPIFVNQDGVGWAMNEADDTVGYNIVSNTTLFDFDHKVLPCQDAYTYNTSGEETASIAGTVVGDDNGTPIANRAVTVTLGDAQYATATDSCGDFFLKVPAASSARLSLSAEGLSLVRGEGTVTLRPGEVVHKTFSVNGGSVSGKVTDDRNKPVAGAVISAGGNGYTCSVSTGSDGSYLLPDLPAGSYTVSVQAPGYRVNAPSLTVQVGIGDKKSGNDFSAVLTSGTVTGIVKDAQGKLLSGVSVSALDAGGRTLSRAVTGPDGRYTLPHVPAGAACKVQTGLYSYAAGETQVRLAAGEVKKLPAFTLDKAAGSLTGTVRSSDGSEISGAQVSLSNTDGLYYSALTDQTGKFTLDSVMVGSYNVSISGEGFIPRSVYGTAVELNKSTDLGTVTMPQLMELKNPGFEEAGSSDNVPAGWTVTCTSNKTGSAATRQDRTYFGGANEGSYGLSLWLDERFTADVSQQVTGLAPGHYIFSAMTYSGITGTSGTLTMYVKDASGEIIGKTDVFTSGGYAQNSVEFDLTGGDITIGFSVEAAGGDWAVIDRVQLGRM